MKKHFKKLAGLIAFLAVITGLTLFLRGPQVSNYLKKLLFTEFESATGYQMTASRLYANLLPFYIEADNVKVFDGSGDTVFSANKVKTYPELVPLLRKTLFIKRIAFFSPGVWLTDSRIDHIRSLAGNKIKRPSGGFRIKLGSVVLNNAALNYTGAGEGAAGGIDVALKDINGEALLGARQEVNISSGQVGLSGKGAFSPAVNLKLDTAKVSFKEGTIGIKALTFESGGSRVELDGSYSGAAGAQANTKIGLLMSTLKDIFHLKNPGGGKLTITGQVQLPGKFPAGKGLADWKKTRIDMDIKGGFYAQSLLELLHAKVDVTGFLDIDGHIKGPLDALEGTGSGTLDKAGIYGVSADALKFDAGFHNGVLSFRKISGSLYGGRAKGEFAIELPKVKSLDMDVTFQGLDSKKFIMGFLKTRLPISDGRFSGRLFNRSKAFTPVGNFRFVATKTGKDFPGRIGSVTSRFNLAGGNIVNFSGMAARTGLTVITGNGKINYADSSTDMDLSLRTSDFRDLSLPYSQLAEGAGGFDGRVHGPIKDPVIEGRLFSGGAVIDKMKIGAVDGDISYSKNLLNIYRLHGKAAAETIDVKGRMLFPDAKEIFELQNPVYDLDVQVAGGQAQDIAALVKPGVRVSGDILGASLKVKGKAPEISGSVRAKDIVYSGTAVSAANFDFDYEAGGLSISRGVLTKGGAVLNLTGALRTDGVFNFEASSRDIDMKDLLAVNKKVINIPVDYKISFKARGSGTFEAPKIALDGTLSNGRYQNSPVGGGQFSLNIAQVSGQRQAAFHLALQGDKIDLKGQALLKDGLPWQANVFLKNGAYDFLIASMFKTMPADLMVSLQGSGKFSGTEKSVNGSFVLNQLAFTAFGQSFSTRSPARFDIRDRTLSMQPVSLAGGLANVNVSGSLVLGQSIDATIEGKSSLVPLKGLSKQIALLTGSANYVFHVGGSWASPKISGGLSMSNVALGIRGVPQNLRILSAYMYMDENKIVLEQLSAKTGGGDANVTGVIYLDKLRPVRYYLASAINNVSMSVKGFDVAFDGNIDIKGDKNGQSVAGELYVKRADYTKNVDWKALILRKKATLPPSPKSFEATTGLNIRVYGSNQIMVKNNVVRAPLSADLTVRGTLANPIPLGRVETSSGKINFRNTEFSIEHASVIFSDQNRINPSLDVMASTTIKGYEITINMTGTLDHMTLAFSSQPHLEQMDILSLLTTGNFGGASSGIEGGIGASEASSFITGQFESVITDRLKNITGFERFQIEPYVSKTTGTVTPRITVSKRLLGDRLFVIYSAPLGTEEQIIRLEYAVTSSVSLIGSRDDTGDIGGDIKYRFRFR